MPITKLTKFSTFRIRERGALYDNNANFPEEAASSTSPKKIKIPVSRVKLGITSAELTTDIAVRNVENYR